MTDSSGVCRPKQIIQHHINTFMGIFVIQMILIQVIVFVMREYLRRNYFPSIIVTHHCIGGRGDDDFIDSRPVWMDYFFETYHSTNTPIFIEEIDGIPLYYGGDSVSEPTDTHSVIKEFDNLMNQIGNPTNIPSIKEEPKHLLSNGISLNNTEI